MATMREIAARAGVSAKTVSRVFNADPHVSPQTRERVETVMRELDYVPNLLATTFRAGRSPVIGVAVPDIVDPFFASVARAVDEVAFTRGMSTLVASVGEEPEREREVLESLLGRQLSGLIVAPVAADQAWLQRWLAHTPIVFVDREPVGLQADVFMEDDEGGAHAATRHLIGRGHVRIGYVGDHPQLQTERKRLAGYRRALADSGIPVDDCLVVAHASDRARAASAVDHLMGLDEPPTAVFSSNARCSMLLVPALAGRRLAYAGFGDFPLADVLHPSWTVIDQHPVRLGRSAAERVLERLDHPGRRLRHTNVLGVALVERKSSRTSARG